MWFIMNITCAENGWVFPKVILELLRAATLLQALPRDTQGGQKGTILGAKVLE